MLLANSLYSVAVMPTVSLREITGGTVRTITALDVSREQQGTVAPNSVSIAEAYFNKGAWFRAIYADDVPVGFVMLFDPTLPDAEPGYDMDSGDAGLWRFMIDHRYQGRGFGRKALDLVRTHLRSRPGIRRLLSSYVPGKHGPEAFYLNYGFSKTGRLCNKDREVEIWITP
jgi:diamine N-acetyltransferase